jgi:hypothetical protein
MERKDHRMTLKEHYDLDKRYKNLTGGINGNNTAKHS